MNIKEWKSLLKFLDSGDDTILSVVMKTDDLKEQLLVDQLKKLTKALCTNDQLLKTPLFPFSTWHFTYCLHLTFHHSTRLYLSPAL